MNNPFCLTFSASCLKGKDGINYYNIKMKKVVLFSMMAVFLLTANNIIAQEVKQLTFDEVIRLSEEQSPEALMAKHRFRAAYWQYRTFVAQYRPSLTLTGTTPDYSNSYDKVWNAQINGYEYRSTNTLSNLGALALSQNIGWTGGTIALNSDFTMFNDYENSANKKYITTPLSISLTQPLFRYNPLKWQKKTEPLKYKTAKQTFLSNIEVGSFTCCYEFLFSRSRSDKSADSRYELFKCRYSMENSTGSL